MRPAPAVLASLLQTLRAHAPFSGMPEPDLARAIASAQLQYFSPGETVLAPAPSRPTSCWIITRGAVQGERPVAGGGSSPAWELTEGEMFPLGALLSNRGVSSIYRAVGDTFCLMVPVADFDALVAASVVFRDFCTRRLAFLLDRVRAQVQSDYASDITGRRGMETPLAALVRDNPVTVQPTMPLADALALLEERRIGSLPVVDGDGHPLGIFTRQDVIGRIVLPRIPLSTPIADVMSAPAIGLLGTASAGDAAMLMTQRGIRHVVVTGATGKVEGVVSERDLFSLHRLSVRELSSAIRRAPSVEILEVCAVDIRALSLALVAQGVGSRQLTHMISSLNDLLTTRILDLEAPRFDVATFSPCWIGMGSEGRGEQTIATDQDNGLVFVAAGSAEAGATARLRLLELARSVNEALARCGYPLCSGGVMAMNPQWCQPVSAWQATFSQWIDRGDPQSLLASSIFFDFRSLWGEARLAQELRESIARMAAANPRFLKQMSDNALTNRPPLSWRGTLASTADTSGVEGIDIKRVGSMPITDAARILALATGVTATGTVDRLMQAGARLGIAAADLASWCEAFDYLQMLRLRTQHRRAAGAIPPSDVPNFVPIASLSELDRRVLKEALRQVRKLQQRLQLDYP
jgi:CBS domain-containing protein